MSGLRAGRTCGRVVPPHTSRSEGGLQQHVGQASGALGPAEAPALLPPPAAGMVWVELRAGGVHWDGSAARGAQQQTLLGQEVEQVWRTGGFGELKGRDGLRGEQPVRSSQKTSKVRMKAPTLEGDPRMVGRGLLCISSLSLGEEWSGHAVVGGDDGATAGSDSCFLIFCLAPAAVNSSRQGALWSREPSPPGCSTRRSGAVAKQRRRVNSCARSADPNLDLRLR